MLYLPPKYAHDGVAVGECMTWSIGFRAPQEGELARELLLGLADEAFDGVGDALYRDPKQLAVAKPAAIPAALGDFARQVIDKALKDPRLLDSLLGEYLTEPKANVWFDGGEPEVRGAVRLDRKTRMLYDADHVFINGESFNAGGKDAQLMQALANARSLSAAEVKRLSAGARELMEDWCAVEGKFEGLTAFAQLVRDALACAAQEGWSQMVWSD
eukprot:gene32679-55192_t